MFKACFSLGESTSRLCGPRLGSGVPWGAGNDLWQHEKSVGCFFSKIGKCWFSPVGFHQFEMENVWTMLICHRFADFFFLLFVSRFPFSGDLATT